jgi:uncharacterized protein YkwD
MKTVVYPALAALAMMSVACNGGRPSPAPVPVPQPADHDQIIAALVDAHNKERAGKALPPLTVSPALSKAAQLHSDDQATHGFMSHTGSDRSSPFDRMEQQGYRYSYAGENVAWGQADVPAVMRAWMGSLGHRFNILSKNYTEIGVGVTNDAQGRPYWTADFGRPINGVKRNTGVKRAEPPWNTTVDRSEAASSITKEPGDG